MRSVVLIDIQWNGWNGFYIELLRIETGKFDGALFYIWPDIQKKTLTMELFFIYMEFKLPFV